MCHKSVLVLFNGVLFNGEKLEFKPTRNQTRGPYFSNLHIYFLLCAEDLSCMLKAGEKSGNIQGIQVSHTAPKIDHLLFADDSILFFKAIKKNATVMQQILSEYCEASRQLVNLVKSSIFFCKACPQTVCDEMRLITKVENESLNEKYLGLPTDVGRMSNGAFKYLKDRVWNKVQGWLEKT